MPMNLMAYTAFTVSKLMGHSLLMSMNLMAYTAESIRRMSSHFPTSTLVYTADLPQAANCSTY